MLYAKLQITDIEFIEMPFEQPYFGEDRVVLICLSRTLGTNKLVELVMSLDYIVVWWRIVLHFRLAWLLLIADFSYFRLQYFLFFYFSSKPLLK